MEVGETPTGTGPYTPLASGGRVRVGTTPGFGGQVLKGTRTILVGGFCKGGVTGDTLPSWSTVSTVGGTSRSVTDRNGRGPWVSCLSPVLTLTKPHTTLEVRDSVSGKRQPCCHLPPGSRVLKIPLVSWREIDLFVGRTGLLSYFRSVFGEHPFNVGDGGRTRVGGTEREEEGGM